MGLLINAIVILVKAVSKNVMQIYMGLTISHFNDSKNIVVTEEIRKVLSNDFVNTLENKELKEFYLKLKNSNYRYHKYSNQNEPILIEAKRTTLENIGQNEKETILRTIHVENGSYEFYSSEKLYYRKNCNK